MLTEKLKVERLTYIPNLAMPKSKIDKEREERIRNEIIVDCYNESERFSGWYCYLEEELKFRSVPSASPPLRFRR
jgi:hypothetical protein